MNEQWPSLIGKAHEEAQFGKVAANQIGNLFLH